MLLGIGLHAALSFFPSYWIVSDDRQSAWFGVFVAAIHGFRMPLFFVMSGFFSAMLLQRRGRRSLVNHRFRRVVLPLLLGMLTLIPLTNWISAKAMQGASTGDERRTEETMGEVTDLWAAAEAGDLIAIDRFVAEGANINAQEDEQGMMPLHQAVLKGHEEAVSRLIGHGADVNGKAEDGSTPLHPAAFLGLEEVVRTLVEHGADVNASNEKQETPLKLASVDEGTTIYFASILGFDLEEEGLGDRKAAIVAYLQDQGATAGSGPDLSGLMQLLMQIPLFHHLWFLWFLWWLVLGLALVSAIGARSPKIGLPDWWVNSPARYLWLVPLTMVPQWFMGARGTEAMFGPDTSAGLVPIPHVFLYYAIFFGFGALYYGSEDRAGQVGRRWWLPLAIALVLVFPISMVLAEGWPGTPGEGSVALLQRSLPVLLQALYPWLMTFGLMGMFRAFCPGESPTMRYLSDSAYWLYLAHLPLIIGAQAIVRDWPLPAIVKFALIVVTVTGVLLLTYQTMVRYHWLGRVLNGPRVRPSRMVAAEDVV